MGEEALKARLVEELRELVKRYPANRFYREALARIEVLE
jgi:outer membrane protein assembly factor BamD (BamD/ComL family)